MTIPIVYVKCEVYKETSISFVHFKFINISSFVVIDSTSIFFEVKSISFQHHLANAQDISFKIRNRLEIFYESHNYLCFHHINIVFQSIFHFDKVISIPEDALVFDHVITLPTIQVPICTNFITKFSSSI